ncbi:VCBS repeat-containing protein [Myxococcota bacterium]|nr:VCBS repeat-containing protein [Myxococcota bacterium]
MDQRVYVFRWDGSPHPGWPVDVNLLEEVDGSGQVTWREGRRIVSTPSVGDIDGDGEWEVVLGTNQVVGSDITGYGVLYALRAGGEADPRGPFAWESPAPVLGLFAGALPYVGEGVPSAPALADLDGDGAHEVFAAAVADTGRVFAGDASTWMALDATSGNFGPGSDVDEPSMLMMITDPALADMNGDGVPDLLAPASGIGYGLNLAAWWKRYEHQHGLAAYDGATGASLPGFPRQMEDVQFFATPAVADVSGDGAPEAIHGSGAFVTHAWDAEGVEPAGWPKVHGGWQLASPAVGDVDGDGWLDVVVATREGLLFAWRTRGRADAPVQWAGFHHDARNTGNVDVEIPLQPGPAEDPPPGDGQDPPPGTPPECGCAAAAQDGSRGSSIAAALVALVVGRRRRGGRVPG